MSISGALAANALGSFNAAGGQLVPPAYPATAKRASGVLAAGAPGNFLLSGGELIPFVPPPIPDVLVQQGVGSTDWAGANAPAGGFHTGLSTITMVDGAVYVVAHSRAEALAKCEPHTIADTVPLWVGFDVPNRAVPVIIDTNRIESISALATPPEPIYPSPGLFPSPDLFPSS